MIPENRLATLSRILTSKLGQVVDAAAEGELGRV
jgi:hypothetical protein